MSAFLTVNITVTSQQTFSVKVLIRLCLRELSRKSQIAACFGELAVAVSESRAWAQGAHGSCMASAGSTGVTPARNWRLSLVVLTSLGIVQGVERPALQLLRGLPREVQFCPWETWFTGVETVTSFKQCLVKHVLLRMLVSVSDVSDVSVSDVSDVSVCDVDDLFHSVRCWRVETTFFL